MILKQCQRDMLVICHLGLSALKQIYKIIDILIKSIYIIDISALKQNNKVLYN